MRAEKKKLTPWELERDIPWTSIDVTKPLLPLGPLGFDKFSLNDEQKLVLSQFLGLMAIQAIAQHEEILGVIESHCIARVKERLGDSAKLNASLSQFFKEEAKHSAAFVKYIDVFAKEKGIDLKSLKKILPRFPRNSLFTKLFLLDSILNGDALWHLVHITELESIDLYRYLKDFSNDAEPVFYELNRLHYLEEIGHISVPPLVLEALRDGKMKRSSPFLSRVLHALWGISQFRHLRHLKALRYEHPFFCTLEEVYKKMPSMEVWHFFKEIYIYITGGKRLRLKGQI